MIINEVSSLPNGSSGGVSGISLPPPAPDWLLGVIIEKQQYTPSDPLSKFGYRFRVLKERDVKQDGLNGFPLAEAIVEDSEVYGDMGFIRNEESEETRIGPAYEINLKDDIEPGTVVRLWPSIGGRHYTFEAVGGNASGKGGSLFPARIDSVRLSSGVRYYGWTEMEFATKLDDATVLANGRVADDTSKMTARELNNVNVPVGKIVWMKKGYSSGPAAAVIDYLGKDGDSGPVSFSLYVDNAGGGVYYVMIDGISAEIEFDDTASTVKTKIETATSLTLTSFTGSGTKIDPWVFQVSDVNDHTASTDSSLLCDDSDYRFQYEGTKTWDWTSITHLDAPNGPNYEIAVNEAVQCDISGGNAYFNLPPSPSDGDSCMVCLYPNAAAYVAWIFTTTSAAINMGGAGPTTGNFMGLGGIPGNSTRWKFEYCALTDSWWSSLPLDKGT